MHAERITLALAWELTILSRREWEPDCQTRTLAAPDRPRLTLNLEAGGAWSSDAEVDPEAARLLDMLLPLCATPDARLAIAQMGQSLDGLIATPSGASHYINGAGGIEHLHRLRALVDAVLVGAGTASADNPQLTVRRVAGPNPVRVILDPNRRVPRTHQVFQDQAAPTLRLVSDGRDLSGPGVTDVQLPSNDAAKDQPLSGQVILDTLAARGLNRVLVEGGGRTVSSFLAADLLDRLHLIVAPLIIGCGRPAFSLPPMTGLEDALRPRARVFDLGSDTLFDLQPRLKAE